MVTSEVWGGRGGGGVGGHVVIIFLRGVDVLLGFYGIYIQQLMSVVQETLKKNEQNKRAVNNWFML